MRYASVGVWVQPGLRGRCPISTSTRPLLPPNASPRNGATAEESTTPDLVALTRQLFDAAGSGDVDALMQFYTPDAVWETTWSPSTFGGDTRRLEERLGAFDDLSSSSRRFSISATASP